MKANIKQQKPKCATSSAPIKYEKILTVGLIVKNEEKVLRRCLESLARLREGLNLEIIVTDTGSTDSSVKIAQEYADITTSFEWCNDFSAARNVAIDMARGEWFLQLDADEWLNDSVINSITAFLSGKEHKNYNTVNLLLRNYTNVKQTTYVDTFLPRMVRMGQGKRFQNPIHEIIYINEPIKFLEGMVSHTGYAHMSLQSQRSKNERNNTLIEKFLKSNPDNVPMLLSYYESVQLKKKDEITLRLKALLKKGCAIDNYNRVMIVRMDYLLRAVKPFQLIQELEQYFAERPEVAFVDAFYFASLAYCATGAFEKGLHYGDLYFEDLKNYKQDSTNIKYAHVRYSNAVSRQDVLVACVKAAAALDDECRVEQYLKQEPVSAENCADLCAMLFSMYTEKEMDFALPAVYSAAIQLSDCPEREAVLARFCASLINDFTNERAVRVIKKAMPNSVIDILLTALASNKYEDYCKISFEQAVQGRALPLYILCMLQGAGDITEIVNKLTAEEIAAYSTCICAYPNVTSLFAALAALSEDNLKILNFRHNIYAFILNQELNESKKALVANALVRDLKTATNKIYSKEFTQKYKELLPQSNRFAVMLEAAQGKTGEEYINALKEMLLACPSVAELIEFLLDDFAKGLPPKKEPEQPSPEFVQLAAQIKDSIPQLIAAGQVSQAIAVLQKLKALVPNDKDVDLLLFKCKGM